MPQQGFNISNFRSSVNANGILKNNKFLVRFPIPRGLRGKSDLNNTSRMLEFWCQSANIPGVALDVASIRRYGYGNIEKKPFSAINNDVSFSFISDGQGAIWTYFQQWLRMIVNYDLRNGINGSTGILSGQKPFEIAYKEDYAVDVQLSVFDDNGNEKIKIVLREAYPIFVGDVPLNWGDTNSYMRIPVTMAVYDWYNENVNTSESDRR